MNATCLVTGGSGFVGQHLLSHLTAQGQAVKVLMRRPVDFPALSERVAALGGGPGKLSVIGGDPTPTQAFLDRHKRDWPAIEQAIGASARYLKARCQAAC